MTNSTGIDAARFDANLRDEVVQGLACRWYEPTSPPFALAGLAWFGVDGRYRRMPLHPSHPLPEAVDVLANCPSGAQIRFRTNARHLALKVRLSGKPGMAHMPPTGQCGFDCYDGLKYLGTTVFHQDLSEYTALLFCSPLEEMRAITLNFPLYQGVEEVLVGANPEAEILPPSGFEDARPVVVYGTSITQGGCASRPGMAFTNILSRRLNREFINLGFSGSGQGEPEMAHIIAEIADPACFVLDFEANCSLLSDYSVRLPEFIRILRAAHGETPILVVSKIRYADELYNPDSVRGQAERREMQRALVADLRRGGDENISFFDGGTLLGEDFYECTVDGIHPTDMGFVRMADGLGGFAGDGLMVFV